MPPRFSLRSIKELFFRIVQVVERRWKNSSSPDLTKQAVFSIAKKNIIPNWGQWKLLPKILTQPEKWIAGAAVGTLIISFIFLLGQTLSSRQTIVPKVGGIYTEGLVGTPQFINPLYSALSDVDADLTRLIYSGLLAYDPKGGLKPDLAQDYSVSEDGLTYTFNVKETAVWHDGTPVRAADVISTFAMIADPQYKSPLAMIFKDVAVTAVDDLTIQFSLSEPFAPFLSTLTVGIMPAHLWQEVTPTAAPLAELNLKPIGSGPYRFAALTKDKNGQILSYTLERFDQYHNEMAKIEQIIFKFYPDAQSLIDALNRKKIDGAGFIPADLAATMTRTREIELSRPFMRRYTALFFNKKKIKSLQNLTLRRALTNATPKEQIIAEVLNGHGRVIQAPILPGMLGYDEMIRQSNFDLQSAKELLAEEDQETLTLTITTFNIPEMIAAAERIQEQWQAAGIVTQIETLGREEILLTIKERDYDVLLTSIQLGLDSDPFAFWHSSQAEAPGLNVALYANDQADKLIEEARLTTDETKRAENYRRWQVTLIEEAAAVFLYQPTYTFARTKEILSDEIENLILPSDRFSDINQWYIETERVIK